MNDFSISHDPYLHALERLHLVRGDGKTRTRLIVAIAWLPLCAGAAIQAAFRHESPTMLLDISVHARLLIVIPLLIFAERTLEERCRGTIQQLYEGNFAADAAVDRIVRRAQRLYMSRFAELAIVAIALVAGQGVLWSGSGASGLVSGIEAAGSLSFARIWYATIALPVLHFLTLRWIWHWFIWSYVVIAASRLRLATVATHPDRAAALGFLSLPIAAFWVFVLALSTMLAAAWGTQILRGQAAVQAFAGPFIAFVVVAALVACGPLLTYVGHMARARYRETRHYQRLALDYVRGFDHKWVDSQPAEPLLGSPDIQSLADLGGSYDNLQQIRLVPFDLRALYGIVIAAALPMIPLALSTIPIEDLLKRVGGVMLGGIV